MSFSSEVKTELAKHLGKSRHCQIAELAALIAFEGRIPAAGWVFTFEELKLPIS